MQNFKLSFRRKRAASQSAKHHGYGQQQNKTDHNTCFNFSSFWGHSIKLYFQDKPNYDKHFDASLISSLRGKVFSLLNFLETWTFFISGKNPRSSLQERYQ
jgi:hypothetical protein